MKIKKVYGPLLLFSAIALGVLIGERWYRFAPHPTASSNGYKNKLNRLIDFIERDYVDPIDTDSIVDLTVNGILEKLDPHSVYISKNEFDEVAESMRGDFVGIGVNFYMYKDSVAVIKPLRGGPSEKAGIKAGDRILFADQYKLFGKKLPNDSLFSRLKGQVGSEVTLTLFRKSENKQLKVKLKRDVIPIKSVDIALMISPDVGFIKINRFAESTYKEFKEGLLKLKKQGAKTIVLDVRDNGGGYLDQAVKIADDFLVNEAPIVSTKNKKGRVDKTKATPNGLFENGKVVVLINENSASASEILAGAIQDNDRGLVVGRRSFGKGLVQREMPLGDGSAVRLTVARYYTPSGRSIQKPYNDGNDAYFNEFEKRYRNGELYQKDSIKVADSLKFKTLKGRTVYGGGGIIPDVFVPLNGKHGDEATEMLMQSGIVSYFVFEQLDQNRKVYEGMTFDAFKSKFESSSDYVKSFEKYLKSNGVSLSLQTHSELVKNYLMAEFARQLFDEERYYELILKSDLMILEVLNR
ncbi:S41 family peptidase [Flavobacterium sp.]|uniref:S41 family peptidase n=1 Tax=Flavobacterium sp. TaxID=239 RepID=UPI002FDAA18B